VERFTSNGLFVSQWGSIGSGNSQFNNPGRVALDSHGNVFVADFGNNRIQVFDSNGKFIMTWGSLGQNDGQFYGPTGMTVQLPQGNVYVADSGNGRVQEFTNGGVFLNKWNLPGGEFGSNSNIDLDVNSNGTIFLTNENAGKIDVISPVSVK
jgi:DNA-binding beta-propeller fold protein YncE